MIGRYSGVVVFGVIRYINTRLKSLNVYNYMLAYFPLSISLQPTTQPARLYNPLLDDGQDHRTLILLEHFFINTMRWDLYGCQPITLISLQTEHQKYKII